MVRVCVLALLVGLQAGCATGALWGTYEGRRVSLGAASFLRVALDPEDGAPHLVCELQYPDGEIAYAGVELPGGLKEYARAAGPPDGAALQALAAGSVHRLGPLRARLGSDGTTLEVDGPLRWELPSQDGQDATALLAAALGEEDGDPCLFLRLAYDDFPARNIAVPLVAGGGCFFIAEDHPQFQGEAQGLWPIGTPLLGDGWRLLLETEGFDTVLSVEGLPMRIDGPKIARRGVDLLGIAWRVPVSLLTVPFDIATSPFQFIVFVIVLDDLDSFFAARPGDAQPARRRPPPRSAVRPRRGSRSRASRAGRSPGGRAGCGAPT